MRTALRCYPILQTQTGDALEMRHVIGHQREVIIAGSCCDQQIHILNEQASLPEIGFYVTEECHSFLRETKNGSSIDEVINGPMIMSGLGRTGGPITKLGEGDHRYGNGLRVNLSQPLAHGKVASQPVDAGVGIEEEFHRVGGVDLEWRAV
jgi:hypothetical protein